MKDGYFSIAKDREVIEDGGFFCGACLVGKPASEQSLDYRCCQDCYMLLQKESQLLTGRSRLAWIPKPQNAKLDTKEVLPLLDYINKQETKMSILKSKSLSMDKLEARERKTSYKKRELPEELIRQLSDDGLGSVAIATRLNKNGVAVSYKTIQRLLSGDR